MSSILSAHSSERTKPIVYSRVMGYTVPVERFNIGKQGEHKERQFFTESQSCPSC
jgi:anaerobic ribonucleoside-triphosphate reductase